MILFLKIFITAILLSLFITPFVIKLSYKIGAIDLPNGERKLHNKPTPRIGGLAIFLSFMITMAIFFKHVDNNVRGLIFGSIIIVICGIWDDIKQISYKKKLFFQIIASIVLVLNNVNINYISMFGGKDCIYIGYIGIPLTMLWVIGVTNAINLIDGLDGLACGLSVISSLFIFIISFNNGDVVTSVLILIIAGASLGFLPYNFSPAKTFMGDTGSLFLGFFLAALSIQGTVKSATTIILIIPILIIGIPIYDTLSIMIRRKVEGKSIMSPDREHFHHRLLEIGFSEKQVVLLIYLINIILGTCAISLINVDIPKTIFVSIIFIATIICITLENVIYNKRKIKKQKLY